MTVPLNAISYAGVGVTSADQLNSFVQVILNYPAMRSFSGLGNMVVCALGASTVNDGGQGHFYWNPTSTATDNNTTVIVPSGNVQGAWIRLTGI